MTTVPGATTPTSSSNSSSSASSASKKLTSNFQTFLTLLTTQLQNQDPTSPMDTNQFTQQLVMYSQVEQQIDTNTKLDSLISLAGNSKSNLAMTYLGKKVTVSDGSGELVDGSVTWKYTLDKAAASSTLTVRDPNGKVVYSKAGSVKDGDTTAGTHSLTWDGKDSYGNTLPDGLYKLTVSATGSDGKAVTSTVASTMTVDGVDLSGTSPKLVVGPFELELSAVSLVTN